MQEITFLGGKVSKRSLPVFKKAPGPSGPMLKRIELPQGELAQFYDGDDGIRYMAFTELVEGGVRGNHFHNVKEEWVYVIQGEVKLIVEDIDSKERDVLRLKTGDLAVIQTKVAHAFQTVQPGQSIEFSKTRFDLADAVRYPLT